MTDGAALNITTTFEVIYCYKCRMPFAVPASIRSDWRSSGREFYCPNGHSQFYKESTEHQLRKQLEAAEKSREWYRTNAANERAAREKTERRLIAQRGQNTKLRKRVGNGVCPCCNRTFSNLQRHMSSKHPDFSEPVHAQ